LSRNDSAIKRANLEAYNSLGTRGGKKEKFWSMVEDYNCGFAYALVEKYIGVKGKKVCELGCGTAAHLKWYKRDCAEIVGLDISCKMLQLYLRTEGNAANLGLIDADALTLPFKNDVFDAVTIYESAHHFPSIYKCMDEMLRVAGAFAFLEPNKDSLLHRLVEWRREGTIAALDDRFKLHDYKDVEFNSKGFSAMQIKHFLNQRKVKIKIQYVFSLPMETSALVMRRSIFLLRR
jgi:SAM-dependent methyltransferase